jgi:hypothetical protein
MDRQQVEELLRQRWRLTDQRFDEPTVDVWQEALHEYGFVEAQRAMTSASKRHAHVGIAELVRALGGARERRPYDANTSRTSRHEPDDAERARVRSMIARWKDELAARSRRSTWNTSRRDDEG